jgi:hypothetical protein
MKRLLALAAVLLPVYLFAQGFGSFSHDQPYLSAGASSGVVALPMLPDIRFRWVASDVSVDGPVTNWFDRIASVPLSQTVIAHRPTKSLGGVYFANASATDIRAVTNTSAMTFNSISQAILIVTSNALPVFTGANNYGNFWVENSNGYGFRLKDNNAGSITWEFDNNGGAAAEATLVNFGASMPQGVQAFLYMGYTQTNWAAFTNNSLSISNTTPALGGTAPILGVLGRGALWSNSSSFRGYVMEVVVWTNAMNFTPQIISQAFDYVTNTYGHFNP